MANPTYFIDDSVVILREAEVVDASFVNGCNAAGSNAPGIGINAGGGAVVGTPEQFTLLDQRGDARTTQTSQNIGGEAYVLAADYPSSGGLEGTLPDDTIRIGTMATNAEKEADPALDGVMTGVGNASLTDLATGWVAV